MPLSSVTRMRWRRRLRSLVALLLLAGFAYVAWFAMPASVATVPLVHVIDGDSLRARIGDSPITVRLAGIDAVEYRQQCTRSDGSGWSCGHDARSALEKLAGRGPLHCELAGKDRYGRTLAACRTLPGRGGIDLGAEMVRLGWAISTDGNYPIEQAEAQAKRRGIWEGSFTSPAQWRTAHERTAPSPSVPHG